MANTTVKSNKIQTNKVVASPYTVKERIFHIFNSIIDNLKRHDEIEIYKVTTTMLNKYIKVNQIKKESMWPEVLISNRYLLYIDQFLNFYKMRPSRLHEFVDKQHNKSYKLPILQSLMHAGRDRDRNTDIKTLADIYTTNISIQLETLINRFDMRSVNINEICYIMSHSGYIDNPDILIVPNDVIIAFVTPLNKYGYQTKNNHITYANTLNIVKEMPGFFKNPSCFLRQDNCFKHTIYYHPGQMITDVEFSIDTDKDVDYLGFYISKDSKNHRDNIFKKINKTKYELTLQTLFSLHYAKIKGKIVYLSGCRKCENPLNDNVVEFLYRYESILNYINISKCTSYNKYKSNYSCKFSKAHPDNNLKFVNQTNASDLFYNSALLYDFQAPKRTKKHKFMLPNTNNYTAFNTVNTHPPLYNVLNYVMNLIKKINSVHSDEQKLHILDGIVKVLDNYYIKHILTSGYIGSIQYIQKTNLLSKIQKKYIIDKFNERHSNNIADILDNCIKVYFDETLTITEKRNIILNSTKKILDLHNIFNVSIENIIKCLEVLQAIPSMLYNNNMFTLIINYTYDTTSDDKFDNIILKKLIDLYKHQSPENTNRLVKTACTRIYTLVSINITPSCIINYTNFISLLYNTSECTQSIPVCKNSDYETCLPDIETGVMFGMEVIKSYIKANIPFNYEILNVHIPNIENKAFPYDYYLIPIDAKCKLDIVFINDTQLENYISSEPYILFHIIIKHTVEHKQSDNLTDIIFNRSHPKLIKGTSEHVSGTVFKPINIPYFGFITYILTKLRHHNICKQNYDMLVKYFIRLCQDDMIICPEYSAIYAFLYVLLNKEFSPDKHSIFTGKVISQLDKHSLNKLEIPDSCMEVFRGFVDKYDKLLSRQANNNLSGAGKLAPDLKHFLLK